MKGKKIQMCDYSCPNRFTMKSHVSSNHGDKNQFECILCDYKCARKYSITLHQFMKRRKLKSELLKLNWLSTCASMVIDKNRQLIEIAENSFTVKQDNKKVIDLKEFKKSTKTTETKD